MKIKPASIDNFIKAIPKETMVVMLYGADSGLADEYRQNIVKKFSSRKVKSLEPLMNKSIVVRLGGDSVLLVQLPQNGGAEENTENDAVANTGSNASVNNTAVAPNAASINPSASQGSTVANTGSNGLSKVVVDEAGAGEIVCIAGFTKATVSNTLCEMDVNEPLYAKPIDPPVLSMTFSVNDYSLCRT
ncbi:hypothetical protein FQR65_LT19880 [Abscondita terminalis]|nr:hypothetical protein FQR65_LT19880 [Abscondita terminalis]